MQNKNNITTNAVSRKYKMQKTHDEPKFQNYKIIVQTPNQKMQNQKIQIQKMSQMSQPHVRFEKQEPTCKINAKPTCCILNPAIQTLYG